MDQIARTGLVDPVLRVVEPIRIGHGVEMIEVTEELVEAVHRRQILVQVAKMVLAELPGRIAVRLQHGGERHGLIRQADVGSGLADSRQSGTQRDFAGDEIRAAGRAARLGVIVGEPHAFGGELVEIRRLAGHDAMVIGADVEPAHIVTHDDENVWLFSRWGVASVAALAQIRAARTDSADAAASACRRAACCAVSGLRCFA